MAGSYGSRYRKNRENVVNHLLELGVFNAPTCRCGSPAELIDGDVGCHWKCKALIERDDSLHPKGKGDCDCVRENAFIKSVFPKAAENTTLEVVLKLMGQYLWGEHVEDVGGAPGNADYFKRIFDALVEWYMDDLEEKRKLSREEMSNLRKRAESQESKSSNKLGIYRSMFRRHIPDQHRRIHAMLEFAGTPKIFNEISKVY